MTFPVNGPTNDVAVRTPVTPTAPTILVAALILTIPLSVVAPATVNVPDGFFFSKGSMRMTTLPVIKISLVPKIGPVTTAPA